MARLAPQEIPPLPDYATLTPSPAVTDSIERVAGLLGTALRISVPSTRREFIGTFVCIDPQGNLVLDQAREWEVEVDPATGAIVKRTGDADGRDVGLVLIKRAIWGTVERLKSRDERMRDEQQNGCAPS
ncbi:hypothetical protein JCM11491_002020 [Sporobolomyces phaffii]